MDQPPVKVEVIIDDQFSNCSEVPKMSAFLYNNGFRDGKKMINGHRVHILHGGIGFYLIIDGYFREFRTAKEVIEECCRLEQLINKPVMQILVDFDTVVRDEL